MSLHSNVAYLEYLKPWSETVASQAHDNPNAALAVAGSIVLAGYVLKRVLTPSPYHNIDGPQSPSFVYGHMYDIFGRGSLEFQTHLAETYGPVVRLKGTFGADRLYINDPRAMQDILVKNADNFQHTKFIRDVTKVVWGPGITAVSGAAHKAQRRVLNPVFSAKHMKSLMPNFYMLGEELKGAILSELGTSGSKVTDMAHWCNAMALEAIGQAGFGYKFGAIRGVKSDYSIAAKTVLPSVNEAAPYSPIFRLAYRLPSKYLQRKIAEYAPIKAIQNLRKLVEIQNDQAQAIMSDTKSRLYHGEIESSNILSALVKANGASAEETRLAEEEMVAQINILVLAGHETTSNSLSRSLHVLSHKQDIQDRLRTELEACPPTLDYDELHALPYLDAFCREIMRLYSPAPYIERVVQKDAVLPLGLPLRTTDGTEVTSIKVTKGTHLHLALLSVNKSKEIWGEDALEFRPERWAEALPQSAVDAKIPGVYSSTMSFSAGPRACIGFKFSILELKVALFTLVRSFKFSPTSDEIVWRADGVVAPFLASEDKKGATPKLPLRVTVLN